MSMKWPENGRDRLILCLQFMVELFEYLEITFSDFQENPMLIAKSCLNGDISVDVFSERSSCYLEGVFNDEHSQSEIKLWKRKLARCLLSVNQQLDVEEINLLLDWLYECLNMYYLYKNQMMMYEKAIEFHKIFLANHYTSKRSMG